MRERPNFNKIINAIEPIIKPVQVIYQTGQFEIPRNPSYKWTLEVRLTPPQFLGLAFRLIHGDESAIVVEGRSEKALVKFADRHGLTHHPRLRKLIISGPDGVVKEFPQS
jgi:hypothetical protein